MVDREFFLIRLEAIKVINMENKQTAVKTLFNIFKVMSKNMRDAGDEQFANTLDYLCNEYEDKTSAMEKEQIAKAYANGVVNEISIYNTITGVKYYNETYGK
jgi:hypothetical protein